ncbi:protein GDAP2 homolog [Strongylocentrotus purpuratus]|uniref:Ganglioside-induced differentiation-associated protein 2 n=1 Tax=Strongylocentrotus purpuratus TaxID=7668 RepID=A0A7M7PEU1_STRPU|nr:protein GDAP2 homolog [Strongylocentrotus purpuratus]
MDSLSTSSGIVQESTLERWPSTEVPGYSISGDERESRFSCRPDLNKKLVLWEGDICSLDSIAIVHPTNESLTEPCPLTNKIFSRAGQDLVQEIQTSFRICRTGDAKLTKGYQLPCRYIIHTVGPRYNIRYRTAAESALYNCYRNALLLAKEQKITSVAFCAIHTVRRNYPPEEGAHIALRTIRRFLEKHGESFETIVLTMMGVDEHLYSELLPLYFPRTELEEQWAIDLVPENIGNEDGEPVIAERKIRIMGGPTRKQSEEEEAHEQTLADELRGDRISNGAPYEVDPEQDEEELEIGKHAFTAMEKNPDSVKRQNQREKRSVIPAEAEQRQRYERLLRRARQEDLSDIAAHRCIYATGHDIHGRPIIAFVARNFPAHSIDLNKVLLYVIHLLDSIVNQDYVVVYFHTMSSADNQPELSWLKDVYHMVDNRYRKNLRAMYIVHPTFWSKLVTWYFTTFTASSIKSKVHSTGAVHYLYKTIHPDQLDIPPFVIEHDMKVNGPNYRDIDERDGSGSL